VVSFLAMTKFFLARWATYSKGGFKEGVSLSVDDEINRWQKYSYGCNELSSSSPCCRCRYLILICSTSFISNNATSFGQAPVQPSHPMVS